MAGPGRDRGLTAAEVDERRRRGEVNVVRPPIDRTYPRIILEHVFPPINIALFSVSLVLLFMGLPVDAVVTMGPVAGYVAVGIWQETRAKRKLDRIALLHRPRVTVRRDGRSLEIDAAEIVLGDLLVLERGDEVPVDGRIVDGSIELDEAVLTGESEPVSRSENARVSSGTAVISGRALVEADRVGGQSLASQLLTSARAMRTERTPGQRAIQQVILGTTGVVAVASVLIGVRMLGAGDATWTDAAQTAAVLVALVPQGLLMVATLTYAMGAVQLAQHGAVVQRIGAIESMSHVDTLCVDKTGTLTTGRISLERVEPLRGFEADALGSVAATMEPPNATLLALRAALGGRPRSARWQTSFSSERGWSAVAFSDDPGRCHLLGAPDRLAPAISDPARRDDVARRAATLASSGHRVLLYASASADGPPRSLPTTVEPIALLAFAEEVRPDAREILEAMDAAGIDLKVVSGDDPRTLAAVARAAGLPLSGAVDGSRVDLTDRSNAQGRSLFGRVDPEGKARLVGVLRDVGRHVGLLGDGVNDILGLKRAHLGIAMEGGSPATRAVADIVLLGDDLRLLPAVLRVGQRIVSAMVVTLGLLLARTTSMVLIVTLAALLALPFPFTPRNNSVLALLTVGIPTVVLALHVAPVRPPRDLLRSAFRFALPSGIGIAVPALIGYVLVLRATDDAALAQTALVDLTVFFGLGLLTLVARRWSGAVMERAERWRVWALAAAMAALYAMVLALPPVRSFFELVPLPPLLLATLCLAGIGWTVAAHIATRRLVPGALGAVQLGRLQR